MREAENEERRCIFCGLNSTDGEIHRLTDEHVIPRVLGGWLTIPFVCEACNTKLGRETEALLKKNVFIVTAIEKLKIQPLKLTYRQAHIELDLNLAGKLRGYYTKKGEIEYRSQKIEDGSIITPEKDSKKELMKKVERWEKKTGRKVEFDFDEFHNLPYDIFIPIVGPNIYFIKRRDKETIITISGLDKPIPFRIPASIAFEHLAGLYYPFVLRNEFDPIRSWILSEEENRFVILNTRLSNEDPDKLKYKPFHIIRIGYQSNGLSAIVVLFGVLKYLVFLAKIGNIDDHPASDVLMNYHVYDLNNKDLFPVDPPPEIKDDDDLLLDCVTQWGLGELNKKAK